MISLASPDFPGLVCKSAIPPMCWTVRQCIELCTTYISHRWIYLNFTVGSRRSWADSCFRYRTKDYIFFICLVLCNSSFQFKYWPVFSIQNGSYSKMFHKKLQSTCRSSTDAIGLLSQFESHIISRSSIFQVYVQ